MSMAYSILPPCFRCNYVKGRKHPAYIIDKTKEVKVIVTRDNDARARRGDCLGILNCGKCLDWDGFGDPPMEDVPYMDSDRTSTE